MKQILYNKYEVLKTIAEGGMGVVYLVKDLHLNKLAAVKECKYSGDAVVKRSAFDEMEILKELSHPALPGIIDFFEEEEKVFLVMEYVDGITLEQYLRKFGRAEVSLAVKWALELAEVLQYLHARNPPVIYRDLKPSNIMIRPDGSLKLIDFGAAFAGNGRREGDGMLAGTPGYSAPEQWGGGRAGKASDIYALGAVLHEMLTGISPRSFLQDRRPVREYDKSISRELEKVIVICTKKKPGERYQSMEDLQKALCGCGRKGKIKDLLFRIKNGVGTLLFLLAGTRLLMPFLRGVNAAEIPFPYFREPLLLLGAAVLYRIFFLRKISFGNNVYGSNAYGRADRKYLVKKQEKSILLTEKKVPGVYISGMLAAVIMCLLFSRGFCFFAEAEEKAESLWVEMRDEKNRKLLLKEGTVLPVGNKVRLEIPADGIPEGKIALQLVATGEAGEVYESRIFLLERDMEE